MSLTVKVFLLLFHTEYIWWRNDNGVLFHCCLRWNQNEQRAVMCVPSLSHQHESHLCSPVDNRSTTGVYVLHCICFFFFFFKSNIIMKNKKTSDTFLKLRAVSGISGISCWCFLLEKLIEQIYHYGQRNHKHKISRSPLYPYCSEPTRWPQSIFPITNRLLQYTNCIRWEDLRCLRHVSDLDPEMLY